MIRVAFVAVVSVLIGESLSTVQQSATGLPLIPGGTEAEIVSAAEFDALAFPTDVPPPVRLKKAFADETIAGTGERACVPVAGPGPFRSGQFIVGGELSGPIDPRRQQLAPKIWWSPLHHTATMRLQLRARRVGRSEEYRFHGRTVVYASPGPGQQVPEGEREYFFPSGVEFLREGSWVVVATQGADWGCFILNLG